MLNSKLKTLLTSTVGVEFLGVSCAVAGIIGIIIAIGVLFNKLFIVGSLLLLVAAVSLVCGLFCSGEARRVAELVENLLA